MLRALDAAFLRRLRFIVNFPFPGAGADLAADAGKPVRMEHMLRAARGASAKLQKDLSPVEVRGS
ncbi:MAG: hypothetical protein GY953_32355 [bacterium]|nr:hypothetical protein [bacterium]